MWIKIEFIKKIYELKKAYSNEKWSERGDYAENQLNGPASAKSMERWNLPEPVGQNRRFPLNSKKSNLLISFEACGFKPKFKLKWVLNQKQETYNDWFRDIFWSRSLWK